MSKNLDVVHPSRILSNLRVIKRKQVNFAQYFSEQKLLISARKLNKTVQSDNLPGLMNIIFIEL